MKFQIVLLIFATVVGDAFGGLRPYMLERMKEPDLAGMCQDTNAFAYRITILSALKPESISVRIQRDGDKLTLIAKRIGNRHSKPDKLLQEKQRVLSAEESAKFLEKLKTLSFFEIPAKRDGLDEFGMDGENWILEGIEQGKYHEVNRWSPEHESRKREIQSYLDVCNLMVKWANLAEPRK